MAKSKKEHQQYQQRYVGSLSEEFWKRVNALPWQEDGQVVYTIGCALQDLECRVVTLLNNAENKLQRSRS